MYSGPSRAGHVSSGQRAEAADIARQFASSVATSLFVPPNGLQRGQQSAVHVPRLQFASEVHSLPAVLAAVSG
jgi:hypothetical protein